MILYLLSRGVAVLSARALVRRRRSRGGAPDEGRGGRGGDGSELVLAA